MLHNIDYIHPGLDIKNLKNLGYGEIKALDEIRSGREYGVLGCMGNGSAESMAYAVHTRFRNYVCYGCLFGYTFYSDS